MASESQFAGWSAEAVDFFHGLEADNSRVYWLEHKSTYDNQVLAPMQNLLEELKPEFGESKIFRPNRDVRFSADKSPYKTAIGATLGRRYVQFSANGVAVGAGCHTMAPDQLDRYRTAVADDKQGPALQRVIAELADAGTLVTTRDSLKSAPRGFPKDHPRIELLRNKDIATWTQWPADTSWVSTPEAYEYIVEALRAPQALLDWLEDNVGDTQLERHR